MALSRCKENHGEPKGSKNIYLEAKFPVGYPNTASICGRIDCNNPGMIWLTKEELNKYNKGQRIFKYATNVCKVKVK